MPKTTLEFVNFEPEDVYSDGFAVDGDAFDREVRPAFDAYMDNFLSQDGALPSVSCDGGTSAFGAFERRAAAFYSESGPFSAPFFSDAPSSPASPFAFEDAADVWKHSPKSQRYLQARVAYAACRADAANLDWKTEGFAKIIALPPDELAAFRTAYDESCARLDALAEAYEFESGAGCGPAAELLIAVLEREIAALKDLLAVTVTRRLTTRGAYDAFEKIFLRGSCDADKCEPELLHEPLSTRIRAHGRDLYGVAAAEAELEARYGIPIETEDVARIGTGQGIRFVRESVGTLALQLENLGEVMSKYPPGFFKDSGVQNLGIVSDLYQKEPNRKISAICQYLTITLEGIQSSFDHELFHALDNRDGLVSDDAQWAVAAHGPYFELAWVRTQEQDRHAGYASPYAFTETVRRRDAADDQAEVAGRLFSDGEALSREAQADPALAAKVSWVKDFYLARSQGRMDERYWDVLAAGMTPDPGFWTDCEGPEGAAPPSAAEERALAYDSWMARGKTDFWKSDPAEAIRDFHQAVALRPSDTEALERLAASYDKAGQPTQALWYFESAARQGSRSDAVFDGLAKLYASVDAVKSCYNSQDPVSRGFEELLASGTDNPRLLSFLARRYLDNGDPGKARSVYENLIEPDPADAAPRTFLIYYYLEFLIAQGDDFSAADREEILDFCLEHLVWEAGEGAFYGSADTLNAQGREMAVLAVLERESAAHPGDTYLKIRLRQQREKASQSVAGH